MKNKDKERLGERLLAYFRASGCEVQATDRWFDHSSAERAGREPVVQIYRLSGRFRPGAFQAREDVFVVEGYPNDDWRKLMRELVDDFCEDFRSDEFVTASSSEELDLKLSSRGF